jgi:hypothetical protein
MQSNETTIRREHSIHNRSPNKAFFLLWTG